MNPRFFFLAALLLAGSAAHAAGFAVGVSPPRFEAQTAPGRTFRDVVAITNAGNTPSRLSIRTADWTLGPDGAPAFADALTEGSCRPWVAIEQRAVAVPPNGTYRFRFEVTPPADTAPRECRFALVLEGEPEAVQSGAVSLPISGRIAVMVYVGVGSVAPDLTLAGAGLIQQDGRTLPALHVTNRGTAHGRLEGLVDGTDASGRRFVFSPSSLPVLPGETRTLVLTPDDEGGKPAELSFPLSIKGHLDWGTQRLDVDQRFAP